MQKYNVESLFETITIDIASPSPEINGGNNHTFEAMDNFANEPKH